MHKPFNLNIKKITNDLWIIKIWWEFFGKEKKILEPLWPDLLLEIQVHDDVVWNFGTFTS